MPIVALTHPAGHCHSMTWCCTRRETAVDQCKLLAAAAAE